MNKNKYEKLYDDYEYRIYDDELLDFLNSHNEFKTLLINGEYGTGKTEHIKTFMKKMGNHIITMN